MEMERSNVVPFGKTPKRPAVKPEPTQPHQEVKEQNPADVNPGRNPRNNTVLRGIGSALRHMLFLVLLWLRVPLRWVFGLAGGLSTFGLLVVLIYWGFSIEGHPVLPKAAAGLAVVSFVSMTVMWLYDTLLMRLSNEPIFFTQ